MRSFPVNTLPVRRLGRAELAAERAIEARRALSRCCLCAHRCGVNRNAGETGLCHAGPAARVFSAQTEVTDELQIVPTFAIALSGCDLRCAFCITGRESWNSRAGRFLDSEEMARRATAALRDGARSVMILGGEPTVFLPDALEIAARLPDFAMLVWKTNGHGSPEALRLLDGIFDVWVADYKFGNDACAERLARVPDYGRTVRGNLQWAAEHTDLIVRHLLMPGHLECCWKPAAEWLARHLPGVKVSLQSAFWPAWKSASHPELRRSCSAVDTKRAFELARNLSLNLVS